MNVTDSNHEDFLQNTSKKKHRPMSVFRSMIFRFLTLILLLILCQSLVSMFDSYINDQTTQKQKISNELSQQWGNKQTIIGPILSIPYVERISRIESQTDSKGLKSSISRDIFNNKTLRLLPENLKITADLKERTLKQNESNATVYEGNVELSGNFNLDSLPEPSGYNTIEWDKAFIAMGLSNNKSVEASSPLRWEGSSTAFKPGTELNHLLKQGFHANLETVATDNQSPQFKIQLSLKGTDSFQFAPFGEITTAKITTDASKVNVYGDISESSKVISDDGFEAVWRISNLSRNYPQEWLLDEKQDDKNSYDFSNVLTGVELSSSKSKEAQNIAKVKEVLPYVIPLIAILFLSLFSFEFKQKRMTKPTLLHYLLVSLPILLMPFVLLTLSSLMSFVQSFQIAAASSILLIVMYVLTSLKSFLRGFYILIILGILYGTLYIILELPEYSWMALSAAGLSVTLLLMMSSTKLKEFH